MTFNKNFYQPNTNATLEMAESILISKGIKGAEFKNMSRSNGVSFYFDFNGREIRVSDHRKTSYYDGIQIDLYEIKTIGINRK
jgi:hypothetical protein